MGRGELYENSSQRPILAHDVSTPAGSAFVANWPEVLHVTFSDNPLLYKHFRRTTTMSKSIHD